MNYDSDLPREARELLQSVMLHDEKLYWTGIRRAFFFRKGGVSAFVFCIIRILICCLITSGVNRDVPLVAYIFITPVLCGVVFLKLPIIQEAVELIYKILQERKGFQT